MTNSVPILLTMIALTFSISILRFIADLYQEILLSFKLYNPKFVTRMLRYCFFL